MGQPQPRALSLLGDPIISPVSGWGCEQQSDTAVLWGIKAQFTIGVIGLTRGADAVVALKNKFWGFFSADAVSTSMQWMLLRRNHLSLIFVNCWCSASMDSSGSALEEGCKGNCMIHFTICQQK